MNRNTKEHLEIINYVREHFDPSTKSINQLRFDAVYEIAHRRNVDNTTLKVGNSYIEDEEPAIKGTRRFDKLIKDWLENDSQELYKILNSYSNSQLGHSSKKHSQNIRKMIRFWRQSLDMIL